MAANLKLHAPSLWLEACSLKLTMQDITLIRTVIIDDEKSAIMLLSEMLKKIDDTVLAGFADNINDGLNLILNFRPHIVFLDIKLHEESGFELIERLRNYDIHPEIVMVTGYNQFGLEALKAGAFDYLLKPVDPNELLRVVSRFRQKMASSQKLAGPKKIRFNTQGGFILINPEEILYCKAEGNYTDIFLSNQNKYTISLNIGRIEKILTGRDFFRISRSNIINVRYLTEINRGKRICILTVDDFAIPLDISNDRLKNLESILVQ